MRNPSLQMEVLSALIFFSSPALAEQAADRAEKAADKAADRAQKAADKAADRAQQAADKADKAAERAADRAQQAADQAADKVEKSAKKAGGETSDSWLTAKTKIALYADSRVSGRQVNVETKNAVVILRGKVDSDTAKLAAAEVAQGIDGVKDVKNELRVVPAAQRKQVEAKDDYIVTAVKDRLSKDKRFKDAKIDVRSDAGVVTLSGEVPTIAASLNASELASAVEGVRSVKNTLEMKQGK